MGVQSVEVPLTYPQQLLWMLDFIHPGQGFAPGFIVRARYSISGPIRLEVMREALQRVIDRHDALRTTIDTESVTPSQRVHAAAVASLEYGPVKRMAEEGWRDAFFVEHELVTRDVSAPPVLWMRLGRVSETEHLMSIVAHHAVCDYWSVELVIAELARCYGSIVEGRDEGGTGPQHSDFSVAQQNRDDPKLAEDLEFWSKTLLDVRSGPLAADHSRHGLSGEKEVVRLQVDARLTSEIRSAARKARCTFFMVMLGGYVAWLARTTGMRDFVVPTITPARHRSETQNVIGYLTNAIPLRIVLSGDPTLGEVLKTVRHTCLEAFSHEVPLVLLLDHLPEAALVLSDDVYVTAPFQFIDNYDPKTYEMGDGCTCRQTPQKEQSQVMTIPVDLLTGAWPDGDGLAMEIAYSAGLMKRTTVNALGLGTIKMIEQLVTTSQLRLSETEA